MCYPTLAEEIGFSNRLLSVQMELEPGDPEDVALISLKKIESAVKALQVFGTQHSAFQDRVAGAIRSVKALRNEQINTTNEITRLQRTIP